MSSISVGLPTLPAMWGPKGQQVMIPTPGQPTKHYGIGAVNYHTRETVVLFRPRKRRREIAELLRALLDKHQTETIYVAWDNAVTHEDDEAEAGARTAAGRLVLLYLPTYSPWLNPIDMVWCHFRRGVTHVSYSSRSNRCWKQAKISSPATVNGQSRYSQSSALSQKIISLHLVLRQHDLDMLTLCRIETPSPSIGKG